MFRMGKKKKDEKEIIEMIQDQVNHEIPDITVPAPGEEEEDSYEEEQIEDQEEYEEPEEEPKKKSNHPTSKPFNMKKEEPRRMTILSAQLLEGGHIRYEIVSNKHLGNVGETYVD